MFGEDEDSSSSGEMSIEETVALLRSRGIRPDGMSNKDWKLICNGDVQSADVLEQIKDALLESMEDTEVVFTYGWEADSPGDSDIITVDKWAGCFCLGSTEFGNYGPFRKIEKVLSMDYFWAENVPGAYLSYDPSDVPEEFAMQIALSMCGEDGGSVRINDVEYVRQGGALVRT